MNNIKNKILIFGLTTFLIGCSQSATSVFDKDPIYAQNVQYSKVIKSLDKETVNAIFNITYLNSVNSTKWNNDKQNFLIGSYTFDNKQSDFKLTLNNKEQIRSRDVLKDDPMYENIAFRNTWANYEIVTFDEIDEDDNNTLTIQYTHPKFQTISTTFIKE
mgnify:CR=1 FL=1